jgi:hypothetical protein
MVATKRCRAVTLSVLSIAGIVAGSVACGAPSDTELIEPNVELIDRTTQALGSGSLRWANGTYGSSCIGHTNGSAWSLRISGSDPMTNAALSVVKANSTCALTLTDLVATDVNESAPAITMTGSYQGTASSFASRIAGVLQPTAFYANAKVTPVDMSADFTVTIMYSNDLSSSSPTVTATYAQYYGSGVESPVAPPNYTVSLASLAVQTNASGVVDTATGTLGLTAGSQVGQSYVVIAGSVGATFAAVDTAYTGAGAPTAVAATIAASAFTLGGVQLPVVRTLILSNTSNGVRAYQVVRITFNAPP